MLRSAWRPIGLVFAAALLTVLSACAGGGEIVEYDGSHDAGRLIIRDFIGTLTIITTEPGGEIDVHVALRRSQQALLPIATSGDELTIDWDGEPDRTRRWWEFWRGRWMFDLNDLDLYPTVEIRLPADVVIEVENIMGAWTIGDRTGHLAFGAERGRGTVGATETASISISGDAEIDLGPVSRHLDIAIAGSGTMRGGTAGSVELSIAGSGEVALGDIAGAVTFNMAGSGSLRLGAVADGFAAVVQGSGSVVAQAAAGAFEATVSGSGSLRVDGGRASPFQVTISGSGTSTMAAPPSIQLRRSRGRADWSSARLKAISGSASAGRAAWTFSTDVRPTRGRRLIRAAELDSGCRMLKKTTDHRSRQPGGPP